MIIVQNKKCWFHPSINKPNSHTGKYYHIHIKYLANLNLNFFFIFLAMTKWTKIEIPTEFYNLNNLDHARKIKSLTIVLNTKFFFHPSINKPNLCTWKYYHIKNPLLIKIWKFFISRPMTKWTKIWTLAKVCYLTTLLNFSSFNFM